MIRPITKGRAGAMMVAWAKAALVAGCCVAVETARAQEPPPATAPVVTSNEPAPGRVSEGTALWLSVAGTAVPIVAGIEIANFDRGTRTPAATTVLSLAGVLVGPSIGHFYARRPGRAVAGVGIRTLALAGAVAAIGAAWNDESSTAAGAAVLALGVGVMSVFIDIVAAPDSARKHNEEVERVRAEVMPRIGKGGIYGLRITARF